MSENAIAGFNGILYVDVGGTQTKVADIREVSISISHDAFESTSHDDSGWRAFITGRRSFTMSAEQLYITGDAAQEVLIDRVLDGAKFDFELRPYDSSGERELSGGCYITSWELSSPNDDVTAVSVEMQGSLTLSDGTVT